MHLYFYVRGINSQVEVWKTLAQSHFWKWKRRNLKTDKEEIILVQGALRPSLMGAYEYIFPEECLAEVLAVFGIPKYWYLPNDFRIRTLRAIFGCKKIPKKIIKEAEAISPSLIINGTMRGLSHNMIDGVAVHTIGIKKDDRQEVEEWGYEQEML